MKNFVLAAAVAVVAFASCQKETTVKTELAPINEIALRSVNGMTKSAINGTTFPNGYDMLVSAYLNLDADHKGNDSAGNYFEGIHFAKGASDKVWRAATPKYWPLTGKLDFLAIACAGLNAEANGVNLASACTWGDSNNAARKVVVAVPDNSAKFDDILFGAANAQVYVAAGNSIEFKHAEAAVVFTAKTNVEYDASSNVGITIDSISVNGAKYSGTLTVSNPAAGASTGSISAIWSDLASQNNYVKARVWDSTSVNRGVNAAEPVLTGLDLKYSKSKADSLSTFPFGEAYVILPEQAAVPFTVTYTIHNGKNARGEDLDNQIQYKYTGVSGNWEQGKKYVYDIDITMNEITIAPKVVDWTEQTTVDIAVKQ